MRAQDIRVGQVLYWDSSKSWQLQVADRPDRAVVVRGGYGRYSRAANQRDVVPARPAHGRAGVWCWSEAQQHHHIIPAAQLRGIYADVIAGKRGSEIKLSDEQHYVLQLLANDGSLHQGRSEFALFYIAHGRIGRVPVRKGTAGVLEKHGFIEKSTEPRARYQDHDWLFTEPGQAWYKLNPRKEGTRR